MRVWIVALVKNSADKRSSAAVHNTANANANAKLKTLSSPEAASRFPLPVRPISCDPGVQKVFSDLLPHSVPVDEVVGTFTHLREATERFVVQIRQDVVEDVIWQLR